MALSDEQKQKIFGNFKKMKLSKEALDSLILKRVGQPNKANQPTSTYTLKDGRQVIYVPNTIALPAHMDEYEYLLGQTFPLHDRSSKPYHITELAFIATEDGKKVPWTRDPKDVQEFYKIGAAVGLIHVIRGADGKPSFEYPRIIKPVLHQEEQKAPKVPEGH